ncbi:MAG: RsmE family RNA methyltransferase, partial [Thermodesulfobacteriota bacterium]
MRRFFLEELTEESTETSLKGDELRHIKVLRLRQGDEVLIFNGRGLEVRGRIESIDEAEARVVIISRTQTSRESPLKIILLAGLPKAHKPDLVVQKVTELGVSSIIFYSAHRSVPEPDTAGIEKKLERWRRIALAASKQCGRSSVPDIVFEPGLTGALARTAFSEVKLFFSLSDGA